MKFNKSILTIFFLLLSTLPLLAQTNYDKGYKDGFAKAYCYNQPIGCIPKAPTLAPIPRINESSNSYQNGYDRGYAEGLDYRRKENSNQAKNQTSSEIKFNPYVSQIPQSGIEILAYKENLYNERTEWIKNTLKQLDDFLINTFMPVDLEKATEWAKSGDDWVVANLNKKKLDFSDNEIFNQIQKYFSNYTANLLNEYNKIKNEADNNVINFDDKYYQNIPNLIRYCYIYFYKNGSIECEMVEKQDNKSSDYETIEKNIEPKFIHKFQVNHKGKNDTLYVLYFSKYDSYHFYLKSRLISTSDIGEIKNHKDCTAFTFTTEYTQGGYGNPIYIKLSENNCMLYDKGNVLNCNYIGEVHYKINKYHNGIFKETYYDKRPCWQDKISGKKYFLNDKSVSGIPICSDNLLVTNNKF